MTDADLLARLKQAADYAWIESGRMARLADAGQGSEQEYHDALLIAQRASAAYNALAPEPTEVTP